MKPLIYLAALLSTSIASAQTLQVAVLDTGLDINDSRLKDHICSTGHNDFTGEGLTDTNGHGTFIASLVERYAGNGDYCLLIYKYFSDTAMGRTNTENEVKAIQEAIKNGAEIVNISGGGEIFNEYEALFIKENPQITFVVAAGNDGKNLDFNENTFYPASLFYKNMIVVSAVNKEGELIPSSNYSKKIKAKELGLNVLSYLPNGKMGRSTGTSISTAIFTGKLIRETLNATK